MNNIVATTTSDVFLGLCAAWCDKHNIGTLSDELIEKNSICIPNKGITVYTSKGISYTYYSILKGKNIKDDKFNAGRLGKYTISNDEKRILFIYRDGKTYVTRNTVEVVEELNHNGYRQMSPLYEVYVPLCPGEAIADPDLKKKWDGIMSNAR